MYNKKCIIITILCTSIIFVQCQRTRDKMYDTIAGASCFRRLNATHQTGCSSTFRGSVGVLHLVKTVADFDFILNDPPAPPYAPIVYPHLFSRDKILKIKDSKYVSAMVLINNVTLIGNMASFSQELRCPNQYGGLLSQQTCEVSPETTWNPFGTGLLHEDFPFPIYYIHDPNEIDKLVNCFEKFNNYDLPNQSQRSLCSIQIKTHMSAAKNSEICMRRSKGWTDMRYCDPLQGKNVYATAYPREIVNPVDRKVDESEKFILVSTRLDTTSMFDGIGPGAMDSLVPLTILFSVGHVLTSILPPENTDSIKRNILYVFFNGESYDYIGSQRFVYDLHQGTFPAKTSWTNPINLTNIEMMIDIGTLDNMQSLRVYHATDFDDVDNVLSLLKKYSRYLGLNTTAQSIKSDTLPPTSAQSILRENITFPAMILTSKSENRFYHSLYDDYENINYTYKNTTFNFEILENLELTNNIFDPNSIQIQIRNLSTILAYSLYELVTGSPYNNLKLGASSILVDEILYCFLLSTDCPLLRAATPPNAHFIGSPRPLQRYVSVQTSFTESTADTIKIVAFLFGRIQSDLTKENCSHLPLYWFRGIDGTGQCYLITQNFTQALSPAFIEDNYNWTSGKYSTWTESTWLELSSTIFLRPSTSHEALTLSIGLIIMIISFVIVYIINSRSDVLFGIDPATATTATIPPAHC